MSKLELLVSGPGTGKTTYCIDLFRKEILKTPAGIDSRAYFVLPNREHASRIQNLVLKKDTPGLFNVHILTIQELGQRLAGAGVLPRPGESMRRSVLRSILEDPAETWGYFAAMKDLPGFYELLSERIQEFRQAMMTAEEFSRRIKKTAKDPVFRSKAEDFARLMRRYDAELAVRGFAEDAAQTLVLRIPSGGAPLVILDGFYHFTRMQKALIEALARAGARMTAALTLPEASSKRAHVFELAENTRSFFVGLGFKPSSASLKMNKRVTERALLHLERSLFLPKPGRLTGKQEAVKILTAETVHDEIENIAREIRRLHRDTDWHYSDMAVILRSVQGYEKSIAAVFKEYDIPVSVHERRRIVESGLGRFIHRIFVLFFSDWQSEDLFSVLRSGYFGLRPSADAAAQLERLSFKKNIRSGRENWNALAGEPAAGGTLIALKALADLEKELLSSKSARSFRLDLGRFLHTSSLDASSSDASALRALEDLLARAEGFYAGKTGQTYSARHFAEEFQRAIEVGLFSEKPAGKNRVQVYDVVMALPKEYRVVFAAGLLDQRFPHPVNEDPFFKDQERRILNGDAPLLEMREARRVGERYFFYMAVTRARNLLYLSYPQKDRDGRSYLPSAFIDEVLRCFTDLPVLKGGAEGEFETARWAAECQAEKAGSEALFKPGLSADEKDKKRILAYAAGKKEDPRFSRILEAGRYDGTARLTDKRILDVLKARSSDFSPTRLEMFLTCAFKYFADHTLKLKPYLEDRLRAETGTMIHAVLERFHSEKRSVPQLFEDLQEEFDKSPLALEPLYRRRALLERAKHTLTLFLRFEDKVAGESGFRPEYFELSFGKRHDGSAARLPYLEIGKERVRLSGSIDRVDVSPDGKQALIIDYKLGTRDLNKKLKEGIEVQLPLYSLVVRDLLKLDPQGAELRFLESGKRSPTLDGEKLKELLSQTQERVEDAARRVRGADISIRSKSCQHCEFSGICRFETWKLVYSEVDGV